MEEVQHNIPEPKGKHVTTTTYVDATYIMTKSQVGQLQHAYTL